MSTIQNTMMMARLAQRVCGSNFTITSLSLRSSNGRNWQIDPTPEGRYRLFELVAGEEPLEHYNGDFDALGMSWPNSDSVLAYLLIEGSKTEWNTEV